MQPHPADVRDAGGSLHTPVPSRVNLKIYLRRKACSVPSGGGRGGSPDVCVGAWRDFRLPSTSGASGADRKETAYFLKNRSPCLSPPGLLPHAGQRGVPCDRLGGTLIAALIDVWQLFSGSGSSEVPRLWFEKPSDLEPGSLSFPL